jgi:hypothetical protein
MADVKCCGTCSSWWSGGQGMRDDIGTCEITNQETGQYHSCNKDSYLKAKKFVDHKIRVELNGKPYVQTYDLSGTRILKPLLRKH